MPSSVSFSTRTRSGWHDRRGFDFFLQACLWGMGACVVVLMLFYRYWLLGLFLFLFFAIAFITLESVSAPPANRPEVFMNWVRIKQSPIRRPVLLCLGDSLTHGNCSSSYTPEIPLLLEQKLGMNTNQNNTERMHQPTFSDPIWVVNAGQNCLTSHVILHERLGKALSCHPDYIFLLIGTNDVRAIYKQSWCKEIMAVNDLPSTETPSFASYERNLTKILDFIEQSSPMVHVAVCTLPPMGEDLQSKANQLVRQANGIIERVVKQQQNQGTSNSEERRVAVVPLFERMEALLEKKKRRRGFAGLLFLLSSVDYFWILAAIMNPLHHFPIFGEFFTWNRLSWILAGNQLLSDGLHLNDAGRDELVDAIVEWLLQKHVAKAIAVKM